ncbi:MAG: GNAT family N-acetyltransferase [Pirellulaceae bacterium]|nr:GNAT family N-acetyltransferase [Pirellulaceae bacterium]
MANSMTVNVLAAGENGPPLVIVEDIPQGTLKEIQSGTADEVIAAKIVWLCHKYGDADFPKDLSGSVKNKLKLYNKIAIEHLYCHPKSAEEYAATKRRCHWTKSYSEYLDDRKTAYLADLESKTVSDIVKADDPSCPRYGHIISAKINGKLVGVAGCTVTAWRDPAMLYMIAVHSEYRGQGVGKALVLELLRREQRLVAYLDGVSPRAKGFLEKLGFFQPYEEDDVVCLLSKEASSFAKETAPA